MGAADEPETDAENHRCTGGGLELRQESAETGRWSTIFGSAGVEASLDGHFSLGAIAELGYLPLRPDVGVNDVTRPGGNPADFGFSCQTASGECWSVDNRSISTLSADVGRLNRTLPFSTDAFFQMRTALNGNQSIVTVAATVSGKRRDVPSRFEHRGKARSNLSRTYAGAPAGTHPRRRMHAENATTA